MGRFGDQPPVDGIPGPPGPPGPGSDPLFSIEADEPLDAGQPVRVDGFGGGALADASALATSLVVGLAASATAPGHACPVNAASLTLADWTAATGLASLVPGWAYYLDVAPGRLTPIPPATPGCAVARVGVAVSVDTLEISIDTPILL
jgi:hypothetical protein